MKVGHKKSTWTQFQNQKLFCGALNKQNMLKISKMKREQNPRLIGNNGKLEAHLEEEQNMTG